MRFGLCGKADAWDIAEKAGYDYFEMPLNWLASLDDEAFAEIAKANDGRRCRVERCNLLYPKTLQLFTASPEEERSYLEGAFGRMRRLGAVQVVFGSGKSRRVPEGMPLADALKTLAAHERLACDIAAGYGVSIVLEPLNKAETNVINSLTEGAAFCALVDRPNFTLLADMFHMVKENEDWNDITLCGSLSHTHIAVRGTRGYPLDAADADVREFFARLKGIGYDGTMSVEGKSANIAEDAGKALAVLRSLA